MDATGITHPSKVSVDTVAARLLGYDPFIPPIVAENLGVELVSLAALFVQSDVVPLHVPLLPATRCLLGREHFQTMKLRSTFINTARGAIVREGELIEVLRTLSDLTAVLDVTDPEPPVAGSPLFTLPNVVITPHLAGSMDRECLRLGEAMAGERERYLCGELLQWEITRERMALLA